jgi:hypothetical protein
MMEEIMDKAYVYIGEKANGDLVWHTSASAMKDIDGVETVLKKVSLAEFEAKGNLVRKINGKIVIGKTDAEQTAETNQARVEAIDRELAALNQKQARSSAEIADALAGGSPPPADSVSRHRERETYAASLRKERSRLLAS